MSDRVSNAADPHQVRRTARVQRRREDRYAGALLAVLGTNEGRLVLWELLTRAGVYASVWEPSAKIHYNAGRQDFGHELLADVVRVSELHYDEMQREMRALARRDAAEVDAARPLREETRA